MWYQQTIQLVPKHRGFHLITDEICHQLDKLSHFEVGILHLFLQHTSASLSINENADPTVRQDFESHFNVNVPEDAPYYRHTYEGPDDMPAHLKSSILGNCVSLPVTKGELNLGIWQGIYLGEHRDNGGPRRIIATLQGQ